MTTRARRPTVGPRRGATVDRVRITERPSTGSSGSTFSIRHPEVAYVFGDMVRRLYVVGCLASDLFVALQVHLSFPSADTILLPLLAAVFLGLAYLELRLYRVLWPVSRRRRIAPIVEGRTRQGASSRLRTARRPSGAISGVMPNPPRAPGPAELDIATAPWIVPDFASKL